MSDRVRAPLPYELLPGVPSFSLSSDDIGDGETLGLAQVSGVFGAGGQDRSPHLRWEGAPPATKSFAVTCFDPDAPTGSGFWHWVAFNLPAATMELPSGASCATGGVDLPRDAVEVRNDAGFAGFLGAAPPPGHGPHRYVFTVLALDVAELGLASGATPALVGFTMFDTTLARASIVAVYER